MVIIIASSEIYYRSALKQLIIDLSCVYGSELNDINKIKSNINEHLETNECLETEAKKWFLNIDNKDFYFMAGCVAQAFYHAVCDQYKQTIDVCVSGLELFKKFVRSL